MRATVWALGTMCVCVMERVSESMQGQQNESVCVRVRGKERKEERERERDLFHRYLFYNSAFNEETSE